MPPSGPRADVPPPAPRRGHALFRHLFVPGLLALSVGSWLFRAEGARLLLSPGSRIDYATAVLLLSFAAVWVAEQAYPANAAFNHRLLSDGVRGWNRLGRDLFYLFVVTRLSALLINAASGRLTAALGGLGFGLGVPRLWPQAAPFAARVLLAFLVVELASYWLHRAAHRVPLLWRFHATHHLISELGGLKAVRTHPVDNVCFYLVRTAPLLLLGAGVEEVVAVASLGGILGILAHANVDVAESPLGWVVNYPRFHAVHHSADVAEANANFGCHTVLWDRVFRTFRRAPAGVLAVGVHPVGTRSAWEELAWPFYRAAAREEAPPRDISDGRPV